MRLSRKLRDTAVRLLVALLMGAGATAYAAIEISSDWDPKYLPNGGGPVPNDPNIVAAERLDKVIAASSISRSASLDRTGKLERYFEPDLSFKLSIDDVRHYLAPVRFMTKSRTDEVCRPSRFSDRPTYQCDEGQRLTQDCHVLIFNERFEEVGYHRIEIKEPFALFCNAVPGVGVGEKTANQLLMTVQYFPIDAQAASKVSAMGSSWRRMTVVLRLTPHAEGKVSIEQLDGCLGNPNRVEDVPTARQALRHCKVKR